MTGWCEETTATRCVPYIFPGLIQHLPCQGLWLHSQPERHRVNMALNQLFPGSDAAKEAVCMVGGGRMALGSRIHAPPTTSPTHWSQFPCPSGQLCSPSKETPPSSHLRPRSTSLSSLFLHLALPSSPLGALSLCQA